METHPFRRRVDQLLAQAGVHPGGDAPTDPVVHDLHFHRRVLAQGSLGLGESYMEGWWDVASLDGMLYRLLHHRIDQRVHGFGEIADTVRARLLNLQAGHRAYAVGERHYDLGNDLFEAMLGKRMVYSCGYWRDAATLDQAQEAKLDLVCRKLGLQPGMRVLDIGCGWGEALKFAAQRHGVSGVGVTISREQADYARNLCAGLPIEIRLQDYRELGTSRPDVPDGLFLLHSIGSNVSVRNTDPWIARYIFPNSMLPSAAQITTACEGLFVIEDWHGFGTDYDLTLQAWRDNIEQAWNGLPPRYDERFRRMWRYYLAASMASFRSRRTQLWQLVLSPEGVPGGYLAIR